MSSKGLKVTDVMDQYENVWISTDSGLSVVNKKGILVVSDSNSKRVKVGDSIHFYDGGSVGWGGENNRTQVALSLVSDSYFDRPDPTAVSVVEKERQKLINQIKGLECESKTQADRYEADIRDQKNGFLTERIERNKELKIWRVFSAIMFALVIVSSYHLI